MRSGGYNLLKRCQFNITFGYASASVGGGVLLPLRRGFGGGVLGACVPNPIAYTFTLFKCFAANCTCGRRRWLGGTTYFVRHYFTFGGWLVLAGGFGFARTLPNPTYSIAQKERVCLRIAIKALQTP